MLVLACRGDQDYNQRGRPDISISLGSYARDAYLACSAVPAYIRLAASVTAAVLCQRSERDAFLKPIATSHLNMDTSCVEAYAFSDAVSHVVKLDVEPGPVTDVRWRRWMRRAHRSVLTTPRQLIQNIVWLRACAFLSGCSVVDYLARQDFVDSDRIAVLELCGGGGNAAAATLRNHRIKALATVSMVDNGSSTCLGWYEIKTHLQCWSLSRLLHRSSRLE